MKLGTVVFYFAEQTFVMQAAEAIHFKGFAHAEWLAG